MEDLSPLIKELVAQGGSVELTVTGSSMEPMLHHGESRVRLTRAKELKRGDLALYRRENGQYVLHRIIDKDLLGYVCCGDAQSVPEDIHSFQVLAMVEQFTRRDCWVDCGSRLYHAYWKTWLLLRPARRIVLGGIHRLQKLRRAI